MNTPRQILMYEALGLKVPRLAWVVPLIITLYKRIGFLTKGHSRKGAPF